MVRVEAGLAGVERIFSRRQKIEYREATLVGLRLMAFAAALEVREGDLGALYNQPLTGPKASLTSETKRDPSLDPTVGRPPYDRADQHKCDGYPHPADRPTSLNVIERFAANLGMRTPASLLVPAMAIDSRTRRASA